MAKDKNKKQRSSNTQPSPETPSIPPEFFTQPSPEVSFDSRHSPGMGYRAVNEPASAMMRAESMPTSAPYQAAMQMLPDNMAYSRPYDAVTGEATQGPGYAGIFRNQPPTYMIPGSPLGFTQETMSMAPWEDSAEGQMFADQYRYAANVLNDPWTKIAMQQAGIPQRMVGGVTPGFYGEGQRNEYPQPSFSPNYQMDYVDQRLGYELPYGQFTRFMTPQGTIVEPNIAVDDYGNRLAPVLVMPQKKRQ